MDPAPVKLVRLTDDQIRLLIATVDMLPPGYEPTPGADTVRSVRKQLTDALRASQE